MTDLSIVNVVGGGALGRELRLEEAYADFPHDDLEYNAEDFSGLIIRYHEPKGTVTLFSSGKYSIAGAKSATEAWEVNSKFVHQMEEMLESAIPGSSFEIRHIVGKSDLGYELELSQIAIALGSMETEYEPEQFPGLFYQPTEEDWFCVLFSSGKVVYSGVKNREELESVHKSIQAKIRNLFDQ